MLINGEKWACEACVRGHRVSSCQHQDRPLIHVNKKGRPVSQCHHCRGLRKARSAHVQCDCANTAHAKEDCPHEHAEAKDKYACCCGHSGRCNCALKKDHLDTVPEDMYQIVDHALPPKDHPKPRLSSMNSHESKMTIFTNGHHKPVHKINDAHNKCGAPYKVPSRSHTVNGHREIAQKSCDSLPLPKTPLSQHEKSHLHESVTSAPQPVRQVKSEHGSPELTALPEPFHDPLHGFYIPPLDPEAYSYSPFGSITPPSQSTSQQELPFPDHFPDNYFLTYQQAHDWEPPLPSAGLSEAQSEVDWSTFDFHSGMQNTLTANNAVPPSQPPSYASLDHYSHISHPGLTSSSGELSEVEDVTSISRPSGLRPGSRGPEGEDAASDLYRLSSASSYAAMPAAHLLASNKLESLDIDDVLEQARHYIPTPQSSTPDTRTQERYPSPATNSTAGQHAYTVHEAQTYAHMSGQREAEESSADRQRASMSMSSMADDPMFSCPPETPGGTRIDDDELDGEWIR